MARKANGKAKKRGSGRGQNRKTGAPRTRSSKTTRASSTARRSASAGKRPRRGATRRQAGASGKGARRTRAGAKGAPTGSTPARASAPRRRDSGGRQGKQVEDLIDVTAEVQERYETEDDDVPTPPSTLDLDRHASAARTGHDRMVQRRRKHTAAGPEITGGDVDADWEQAYFVGDESATADNPTPDQSEVEDIGHAVGVDYEDNEELKSTSKVERRDRKRWELDPASSQDYPERNRKK